MVNEPKTLDTIPEDAVFSWTFQERENHLHDQRWYLGALLVVILLLLYSFVTGNILFAILIIIASFTILLLHRNDETVSVYFTEAEVVVNNIEYRYSDLRNFFIIYQPPGIKKLFIVPSSILRPRLTLKLEDQNPADIRAFLLEKIDEDESRTDEPVSERFSRYLKL